MMCIQLGMIQKPANTILGQVLGIRGWAVLTPTESALRPAIK